MISNPFIKTILYLCSYCIYPFSFITPRSKKKWTFGSFRGAFNDNSKYLFIEVQKKHPEINSAWISCNKETVKKIRSCNLTAYYLFSCKGIWHALTSKYWIYNAYTSDILFCLSGNTTTINLWHGLAIKNIEFDINAGPLEDIFVKKTFKSRFFYPQVYKRPNHVLAPSEFYQSYFSQAFRIDKKQCISFSYPRTTILTCDENERKEFIRQYEPEETHQLIDELSKFEKTFIYMPTWRDSQKEIISSNLDLSTIEKTMQEVNGLFLIKPHANTIINDSILKNFRNIKLIDSKSDVYTILPYTSALITDYSSIMYDYMLMKGKDIILYLYDFEEYTKDRTFIFPFNENTIGAKTSTFNELIQVIKENKYSINIDDRERIITKLWDENGFKDTTSSLIKFIETL
ncbi:MAG: CDP-glycerol glycerophosphotransferase family protein [Bacteroidales bacterium]|nr:CDP-glycerol glycerophosphotransferase family protein [Bacteroidales bacterium]